MLFLLIEALFVFWMVMYCSDLCFLSYFEYDFFTLACLVAMNEESYDGKKLLFVHGSIGILRSETFRVILFVIYFIL